MEGARAKISSDVPLVSVLICAYNAQKFIEATIRSVMAQTYRNIEILVLDNNSSDGTVAILEGLKRQEARLRLYGGKKNLGAYGGLNYLLERAAGTYIAIQDHDDLWHPDKIARQVEFLEKNHAYVGCGTAIINYYERYDTFLSEEAAGSCAHCLAYVPRFQECRSPLQRQVEDSERLLFHEARTV